MRDDIKVKEKGLPEEEVYDRATQSGIIYRQTSTPHKSGNKMKKKIDKLAKLSENLDILLIFGNVNLCFLKTKFIETLA